MIDPEPGTVFICWGKTRCLKPEDRKHGPCEGCYEVKANDARNSDEIVRDMQRVN